VGGVAVLTDRAIAAGSIGAACASSSGGSDAGNNTLMSFGTLPAGICLATAAIARRIVSSSLRSEADPPLADARST
jgi:hypothetical protein